MTSKPGLIANGASSTPLANALLIEASEFARLLSVSKATFARMKAAGRLPRHVQLSRGCHRWNAVEARDWINAGCPPVREFAARRRVEGGNDEE
jgi:predicted DNA-binding transcriptional regulator AlpA